MLIKCIISSSFMASRFLFCKQMVWSVRVKILQLSVYQKRVSNSNNINILALNKYLSRPNMTNNHDQLIPFQVDI